MVQKLRALTIVIAALLCSVPAYAQKDGSPAETKKAEEALREKAFAVLESLAGQLGSLQSNENRARIGSNLAESIWDHDEKRARELFALVQQDISAGLQVSENPDQDDTHALLVFMHLRADTIDRMARHDPELAYSFFKATQFGKEQQIPFSARLSEHTLELHLAQKLANSNPDLSLELGLKLLEPRITNVTSDKLRLVLRKLNRKHKDQALVLYKAMVSKLKEVDFLYDWEGRNFAIGLVNSVTPPAIEEASFRELVGLFIKTAVANGCMKPASDDDEERQDVCNAVGAVVPQIAKVDPARATRLKRWQPDGEDSEPFMAFQDAQALMEDWSVDDLLQLAAQNPQAGNQIRFQAIQKARGAGDYETARRVLALLDVDKENRDYWLQQFDREQGRVELDERRLAEAQKQIAEIPRLSERARRSMSLASQIAVHNRANALKLLTQTAEMVETMKPSAEQSMLQLFLAVMFCTVKSDRGLAMMEAMVPRLNELVEASAKLDGFGGRYLRDGEWNMSAESTVGNLLTEMAKSAGYFAWFDFDGAVNAAGQFQRTEIRMMAQLKLAQGILAGPPKPLQW